MATRFELRAPNPKSNTYLVLAVSYMAIIDGIKAALGAEKTANELELSLSKKCGDADFYLEKDREYRSEKDVFEDFSEEDISVERGTERRSVVILTNVTVIGLMDKLYMTTVIN